MKKLIARFVRDESGATAIEYGLIAAGISIAIIVAVNGLGSTLNNRAKIAEGFQAVEIQQARSLGPHNYSFRRLSACFLNPSRTRSI